MPDTFEVKVIEREFFYFFVSNEVVIHWN